MTETFHPTYAPASISALPTWFYACLVCEETRLEGTPLCAWITVGNPLGLMRSIGLLHAIQGIACTTRQHPASRSPWAGGAASSQKRTHQSRHRPSTGDS